MTDRLTDDQITLYASVASPGMVDRLAEAVTAAYVELDRREAPEGWDCAKHGRMQVNPHPLAGDPHHLPQVGATYECFPCLLENRSRWADRAMKAETQVEHMKPVVKAAEAVRDNKPFATAWLDAAVDTYRKDAHPLAKPGEAS